MYPGWFLFAPLVEETGGVPLSVLLALSRMGLDPGEAATRLSRLTKEAAANQLARMIGELSGRRWSVSEARTIAGGLIQCLPTANVRPIVPLGSPVAKRQRHAGLFDLCSDRRCVLISPYRSPLPIVRGRRTADRLSRRHSPEVKSPS